MRLFAFLKRKSVSAIENSFLYKSSILLWTIFYSNLAHKVIFIVKSHRKNSILIIKEDG